MEETEVDTAGSYAIAVYFLYPLWLCGAAFLFWMFKRQHALHAAKAHARVHPETDVHDEYGLTSNDKKIQAALKEGMRVEAFLEGEWLPGTISEIPSGDEKKWKVELDVNEDNPLCNGDTIESPSVKLMEGQQVPTTKGKRCLKRCCPCRSLIEKSCPCCKTLCPLLFESSEFIIGTAAYCVPALVLIVLGTTQLPLEKPYCATEPRSDLSAVVDEPAERFSMVWCEIGALSSVLLGFLGFCTYVLAFSMLLRNVMKNITEERVRNSKHRLAEQRAEQRNRAMETGRPVILDSKNSKKDAGQDRFQISEMNLKEERPEPIWQDYDGRIFDI
jgi:hypothetical protein